MPEKMQQDWMINQNHHPNWFKASKKNFHFKPSTIIEGNTKIPNKKKWLKLAKQFFFFPKWESQRKMPRKGVN